MSDPFEIGNGFRRANQRQNTFGIDSARLPRQTVQVNQIEFEEASDGRQREGEKGEQPSL